MERADAYCLHPRLQLAPAEGILAPPRGQPGDAVLVAQKVAEPVKGLGGEEFLRLDDDAFLGQTAVELDGAEPYQQPKQRNHYKQNIAPPGSPMTRPNGMTTMTQIGIRIRMVDPRTQGI